MTARTFVTSPDDPRLDPFRAVADPERLRTSGLFVAEGRRVVSDLLGAGRYEIRGLLLTRSALAALEGSVAPEAPEILVVDGPAVLRDVTGYRFHQGCLALARRPADTGLEGLAALDRPGPALLVVLEGVTDPDNVGTIFRSARAFGADGVVLGPGCAHPLYRKALRTSLGTALHLPFASATSWPDDLGALRQAAFSLVALTPAPEATDLRAARSDLPVPRRVALLLGSEEKGLTAPALAAADVRARIVHADVVDSLNVAAAAAIALHALSPRGG